MLLLCVCKLICSFIRLLIWVLRRFQYHFSYITATVQIFVIPVTVYTYYSIQICMRRPARKPTYGIDPDQPKHAAQANLDRHVWPPLFFQESLLYT